MVAAAERLLDILTRSQELGFLGSGELETQIQHARAHRRAADPQGGDLWCDLGSGGGIPGLVMAVDLPSVEFVCIDRSQRRAEFLIDAIRLLGLGDRVRVAFGDAADLAHVPEHRHKYTGVVSRLFGPPSATAECSSGLLCPGGRLVVSEPPGGDRTRWPAAPLGVLGLSFVGQTENVPTFSIIERQALPDEVYPRSWKRIRKRPLF